MKCHNCEKNALYLYGPKGQEVPLCLDCYCKITEVNERIQETLERQINFLTAEMEATVGMPGILPRYPERRRIISTGGVTLNNINVINSEIGVLNTGNLRVVDSVITALKQNPATLEISAAISKMANAITQSTDLAPEKKNEAMEILGTVASETVQPKQKRRNIVVKTLLDALPTVIQTAASAMQIWQQVEPTIRQFFQ
jgi:hypothetical protein